MLLRALTCFVACLRVSHIYNSWFSKAGEMYQWITMQHIHGLNPTGNVPIRLGHFHLDEASLQWRESIKSVHCRLRLLPRKHKKLLRWLCPHHPQIPTASSGYPSLRILLLPVSGHAWCLLDTCQLWWDEWMNGRLAFLKTRQQRHSPVIDFTESLLVLTLGCL